MPIFDQGYQHWSGHLSGPGMRWWAITRNGFRTGMKSRWVRMAVFVALTPALALAGMLCVWGLIERQSAVIKPYLGLFSFISPIAISAPITYRVQIWTLSYTEFMALELRLSLLLILLVGPNLISQDLRFNALPLYLSRPLRRRDYFLGKLGIIALFLSLVVIAPSILAYILGLLFSLDISIIHDTFRLLVGSVVYGVVIVLSGGMLILALSAMSRNSRYVALMWLGIWIVGAITATILQAVDRDERMHARMREYTESVAQDAVPPEDETPRQRMARMQARQAARQRIFSDVEAQELAASQSDWRPLISYAENLSRIGQQLLGSDAAWKTMGELEPDFIRERFLYNNLGPQYPWYWSAAVLAGLFGLSACLLTFPIKSLDRLK
jgi:ABC-2 type transport system permease protein